MLLKIQNSELTAQTASNLFPTLALLALASGITAVFYWIARQPTPYATVPETIGLLLAAGVLYVIAAYVVQRFALGLPALLLILGAALAFRLLVISAPPTLSADVYRYQWEGRVQRAGINPYATHPDTLRPLALEDPAHPLDVGRTTPTLYPPFSEESFSWAKTITGYKRLYAGLDVASIVVLLLLLTIRKQPLQRVLMYAWNPGVVVAFSLCGHHDSLAILALLAANLLIIKQRPGLSIAFLALSFLSKFYGGILLPVFLKRTRWRYAALFATVVVAAYVPYASAGRKLLDGLLQYSAVWENNDSLFRLMMLAGNTRAQAGLLAGAFLAALVLWALKRRMEPLQASLFLIAGLLLLSPNAFPWYFTWSIPFMCFYADTPWLLLSVTCVLGYSPLVGYAAGQPYVDSPLILALEYAPVFAWLAWAALRETRHATR